MKYRKDFVTNSSSSSYTCEICGATESGFDIGLRDVEMVECENGHTICESEMLAMTREDLIKMLAKTFNYTAEQFDCEPDDKILSIYLDQEDGRYNIPECCCPICQFIEYSQNDLARYLEKKYKVSREEVFEKIKQINKRRKKLYNSEYVTEVCNRFNLNPVKVVSGLKNEFGSYRRFSNYIWAR